MRLALLTDRRYERPTAIDAYVGNILREDAILAAALAARGIATERVDWARPDVDWSTFDAAMFRTTWDYFERLPAFLAWLDQLPIPTLNPLAQVRWNLDKRYLLDLQARGVRVVDTVVLTPGDGADLAALCAERGWTDIVAKPTVSGAAWQTWRGGPELAAKVAALTAERPMLIQPFLRDVIDRGEISVIVLGGRPTHAVLKRARPGDFRVQDDHGGTVHDHVPTAEELAFAGQVVAACDPRPIYARVDMVRDDAGRLAVMELELIEPELFLRNHPAAAELLADAIAEASQHLS